MKKTVLCILLAAAAPAAFATYKCVDEKGITRIGETPPDELYAGIASGLLLTDLMGFGVNMTTGDFSRGAQGFWIENGRIAYPVTEINLSGNLIQAIKLYRENTNLGLKEAKDAVEGMI